MKGCQPNVDPDGIVAIDDVTTDGRGIGRLADGRVAFVAGALPGDRVRVRSLRSHPSRVDAEVAERVESSVDRVEPPCPHQASCGGCPLMPLDATRARQLRVRHLTETMRRVGGLELPVDGVIEASRALRYRVRLRFAVLPREAGAGVGFHAAADPGRIVPIDDCLIGAPDATRLAAALVRRLAVVEPTAPGGPWPDHVVVRSTRDGRVHLLALEGPDGPWPAAERAAAALIEEEPSLVGVVRLVRVRGRVVGRACLAGRPRLSDVISGHRVKVDAESFLQVHPEVAERLYEEIAAAARAHGEPDSVLDLFCGQGLAGIVASGPETRLVGIERDREAVRAARRLARRAGLERARFRAGDALRAGFALAGRGERFEVVIANPPRAGAGPALSRLAASVGARRVALVSCHPATLARDARAIVRAGFRPARLVAADMFPQTTHIEALLVLERRA